MNSREGTKESPAMYSGLLIIMAFATLTFFLVGYRQLNTARTLDASGVVADGVITAMEGADRQSANYYVAYEFKVNDRRYSGETKAFTKWLGGRKVGSNIPIRYLAANPAVSRIDADEKGPNYVANIIFGWMCLAMCVFVAIRLITLRAEQS